MFMDPILQKFKLVFLEEASGLLDQLEKDLLDLEASPEDKDLIESAFRAMHTIKGVSGMYGFEYVGEFTHNLESLYQAIRDKAMRFDKRIFDVTFQSVDHIRKLLHDEQLSSTENQTNQNTLMADIKAILETSSVQKSALFTDCPDTASKSIPCSWHILIRANEQIYFRGISITSLFHDLASLGQFEISRLDHLSDNGIDTWSIILYSSACENDIREVFMFIEDDCTITRLTNRNLFEDSAPENPDNEQSIIDFIEYQEKRTTRTAAEINPNAKTGKLKMAKNRRSEYL